MKPSTLAYVLVALANLSPAAELMSPPAWLSNYPGAVPKAEMSTTAGVDWSYSAAAKSDAVLAHYRQQLQAAAITFRAGFDGIGTSIRATTAGESCVVRIVDADAGVTVKVHCANNELGGPVLVLPPVSPAVQTPGPSPGQTAANPPPPLPGVHTVEYEIDGSASLAAITARNPAGGTEQHEVRIPYSRTFYVRSGAFLYLSAQKKSAEGTVHVTVRVDGKILQQATSSSPYGIATASGRVAN